MEESPQKVGITQKILNYVERTGNKLPQPVTLFVILILIVLLASLIASWLELSVVHPGTKEEIRA